MNVESGKGLSWAISPDGSRIAVQSGERPHQQIRILDLRSKTESTLKLPNWSVIWSSSWAVDGNALFASVSHMTSYQIVRIELNGKTSVLLDRGRNQWLSSPVASSDGRHLGFTQQTFESNVWLLENY